jgi:RNA polymerase sigma factor (sigma-70 family)
MFFFVIGYPGNLPVTKFVTFECTGYPMNKTQQMTTSLAASEQDLLAIREIRNGNPAAYEKIIRRYNQQLFRIGTAWLGADPVVEDVMQNTYLKAWHHLPQFRAEAAFGTWLIRIMINECKQVIRKKENERRAYQQLAQDKQESYDQGIQKTLMQKEMKERIQEAVLLLPVKYRTVFMMREVEQLSTEETAQLLDISAENVKVRLLRAKAMIRKTLLGSLAGQELFTFRGAQCDTMVKSVMEQILHKC